MELSYAGLCSYRIGNGRLCRCHLQVYRDGDAAVVVATELEDNPGPSITNSYEHLATGVWQRLGLTFEQTKVGPTTQPGLNTTAVSPTVSRLRSGSIGFRWSSSTVVWSLQSGCR